MKTVIEMAHEAGFSLYRDISAVDGSIANLERFAELVAAAENEACAMWAWSAVLSMTDSDTADKVLAAIRARKKND